MPSFAEVKVLQQQNMLNVHHMHTWVCTVFKWNYEQHLYTHTLIPIINRFASTNEPLRWYIHLSRSVWFVFHSVIVLLCRLSVSVPPQAMLSHATLPTSLTSHFLSLISPGWVVMFLDTDRIVYTFCIWFDSLGIVPEFLISILIIFRSLRQYLHSTTDITKYNHHLKNSKDHTLIFCQKFRTI